MHSKLCHLNVLYPWQRQRHLNETKHKRSDVWIHIFKANLDSFTSHSTVSSVSGCLVQLAQYPDCVAQCQQEECFPAQISTPHKCLALCLTLSGL